jgi:hypothetical protein
MFDLSPHITPFTSRLADANIVSRKKPASQHSAGSMVGQVTMSPLPAPVSPMQPNGQETISFFENTGGSKVQAALDDKHNLTESSFAGDPVLERVFDAETIVKVPDHGEHVRKIQQALIDLDIELPEFGVDASYGNETRDAVIEFQQEAGMTEPEWDGIVGRKTLGLLDKSARNGKIELDTDSSESDFTVFKPKPEDTSCAGQKNTQVTCDPAFFNKMDPELDKALGIIDKVKSEQLPPKDTDKVKFTEIYNTLFRFNDTRDLSQNVDEVKKGFDDTRTFLQSLKTNRDRVKCGTSCDGGCRAGNPAYHTFRKKRKEPHQVIFCDSFDKHPERLLILIHESHHAGVAGSSDFAYPSERLIKLLDFTRAVKNAASYHLYASSVVDPGGTEFGQKKGKEDKNVIGDPAQKKKVNQSLAFIEHWFSLNTFDVSLTIQQCKQAKAQGSYDNDKHRMALFTMENIFSKWFGLTKPPAVPTEEDIQKLKAIEERLSNMENALDKPFSILETKDASDWLNDPDFQIKLNPDTLSLDMQHITTALLQELVNSIPNISAELEPLYVGTINDLRNLRDLDP